MPEPEIIIRAENLGKKYVIRHGAKKRADTFRDALASGVRALGRRLRHPLQTNASGVREDYWALKDVNFEIKRGQVVGIVGRNGAGKSTLLKILSRITEPTTGRVTIDGRVGSLLEVGTGFHSELSGRENIYLNGAILGMTRAEIARKFDEIVAFAEFEKFLDTPVKHYSSGMYMRLGFAVAVHLEPEILVIDEVLAVGDAEFQKKCFEKMSQVGSQGRTILFVSHNLAAMRTICQTGVILHQGRVVGSGKINEVADSYLETIARQKTDSIDVETESCILHEVSVAAHSGKVIKTFDPVTIRIRGTAKVPFLAPEIYFGFLTADHYRLAGISLSDFGILKPLAAGQEFEINFLVEDIPFLPGSYQIEIHINDHAARRFEVVPSAFVFDVVETPVYGGQTRSLVWEYWTEGGFAQQERHLVA